MCESLNALNEFYRIFKYLCVNRGQWEESRSLCLGRDRSVGGLKEDKWIAPPQDAPITLRLENGVALRASKMWTMKGVDTSSRIARILLSRRMTVARDEGSDVGPLQTVVFMLWLALHQYETSTLLQRPSQTTLTYPSSSVARPVGHHF